MPDDTEKPQTQRIGLRINHRDAQTIYVNSFKSQATPEEFLLDVGINRLEPTGNAEQPAEVHFTVGGRLIMNYQTTKRLAAALVGVVQKYEEQFGPIATAQQTSPPPTAD